MQEAIIVNHIDIADETFLMDALSEENGRRVKELMQERLMEPIGYKKHSA